MQRGGVEQVRLAVDRLLRQRPLISDDIAVRVGGGTAVQADRRANERGLVRPGICHGWQTRLGCPI